MNMKKISLENRKEYINSLNSEIEEQQRIINLIESYIPSSLEEKIIHEYAILGSVTNVSKKLNEEGWRIEGRKYNSNDISAFITGKGKDELHQIVRKAFEHNKKGGRYS